MSKLTDTAIRIDEFEITQSIQNVENCVTLLQGKDAYVRVYYLMIDDDVITYDAFTCELTISFDDQDPTLKERVFYPINEVAFNKRSSLMEQRLSWTKSINFRIPAKYLTKKQRSTKAEISVTFKIAQGRLRVGKEWVQATNRFFNGEECYQFVKKFKPPTELNLRVVGYRYSDFEQSIEVVPTEAELRAIQEFIQSAFPVSTLNWSTIIIDAPREFRKLRSTTTKEERVEESVDLVYSLMFQHLLAIRNQDLSQHLALPLEPDSKSLGQSKRDENTIYLGVISDPTGRLGGAAMSIPQHPTTHVVAFTEPDSEGVLGAHELAHLLGRFHPGIPDKNIHDKYIGQSNQYPKKTDPFCKSCGKLSAPKPPPKCSDYKCVHSNGLISFAQHDEKNIVLGVDQRKTINKKNILRHDENYDLMTYIFPQWLSPHSYEGILKRVREVGSEELGNGSYRDSNLRYLNVIGDYQLNTKSGAINSALPTAFMVSEPLDDTDCDPVSNRFIYTLRVIYKIIFFASINKASIFQELEKEANANNLDWFYKKIVNTLKKGEICFECFFPIALKIPESDANRELGVFQEIIPFIFSFTSNFTVFPTAIFLNHRCIDIDVFHIPNIGFNPVDFPLPDPIDDDPDPIYLEYDVDEGNFYLNYDLVKLKESDSFDMTPPTLFQELPYSFANQNADALSIYKQFRTIFNLLLRIEGAITTTTQFKRNRKLKGKCDPHCSEGGEWQTVGVSNRRNERIWLNPVVSARLNSRGRDEVLNIKNASVHEFPRIKDVHGKKYSELGIEFRVLVTFFGLTFVLCESECGKVFGDKKLKSLVFRIKATGSMGRQRENYHVKIDETSEAEAEKHRKYYKPTAQLKSEKCE